MQILATTMADELLLALPVCVGPPSRFQELPKILAKPASPLDAGYNRKMRRQRVRVCRLAARKIAAHRAARR